MRRARARNSQAKASTLQLMESSFGLLRQNAFAYGFWHTLGTLPFLLYFVYFVEDASFGVYHSGRLYGHAIFLTVLYIWMRACQSLGCEALRRWLTSGATGRMGWRDLGKAGWRQARLQGVALLSQLLSLFLLLAPFGWTYGYSQALVALGGGGDSVGEIRKKAWRVANQRAGNIHVFLCLAILIFLVLWINFGTAFAWLPGLARQLLGLENRTAFTGWDMMSTTYIAIVFSLAYFVFDALAKAFFTQLCFQQLSQKTGEDLLARLAGRRAQWGMAVLCLAVATSSLPKAYGEVEAVPAGGGPEGFEQRFERHVEAVLAQPEFSWRIERGELLDAEEEEDQEGVMNSVADWMKSVSESVGSSIRQFVDWLWDRDEPGLPPTASRGGRVDFGDGFLRVLSLVGIVVAIALLILLIVKWDRRRRAKPKPAETPSEATPDLKDEAAHAAQLPANRWLDLAREKAAAGDHRLAIRALFLASLSSLAERRLIGLARHKSNFDYQRELERRSLPGGLLASYGEFRRTFDAIWYGSHAASEELYRGAMEWHRRIEEEAR